MFLHTLLALALSISPTLRIHGGPFFVGHEVRVRASVTVPVDRDNLAVGIIWDGDESGATSRQLDELVTWVTHTFEIRLRPGAYDVRGVLRRSPDKIIYTAIQHIEVRSDIVNGE
jgi:hypothetical protein